MCTSTYCDDIGIDVAIGSYTKVGNAATSVYTFQWMVAEIQNQFHTDCALFHVQIHVQNWPHISPAHRHKTKSEVLACL